MLDFSKVEAGKLDIQAAPVRVGALVENVVELLAPKAHAKNLEIGAMLDPALPEEVTLDATRVRQILFNLIGNGVKFTDEGGVAIELTGRANPDGGSYLDIDVRDTGIGFDADEARTPVPANSSRSITARRASSAVPGLGLAIAQRLAGLMGGEISASPSGEGGALFRVSLPIPEELTQDRDPRLEAVAGGRASCLSATARSNAPCWPNGCNATGPNVCVLAPGNAELDSALASADLLVVDNGALSDSGGWLASARLTGCQAPADRHDRATGA